ncbi:serine/threonine-protein kinase [Streptomyces antibioticus]|uniref:hypothetical protein n=1 Tax=Streptomyces antibioticus TaxID=1890 RepID=UPI0036DCCBA2
MRTDAPPPTDPAPDRPHDALSRAEATEAVEQLLRATARLRRLAADRYPLYAVDGNWTFSRRGSWTPGFWAGLLRLTARITGDRTDRRHAAEVGARLAERLDDDTVTRSMTFWYGAGADRPDLAREAARRLLATALPNGGPIPVGTAWGPAASGRREVEVDCWGPLVRLLAWSAPELGSAAQQAAVAQTRSCLDGCLTATGPRIVERLIVIDGTPAPASPPTSEARPAAWALLGLAESADALAGSAPGLAADCVRAAVPLSRPPLHDGSSAEDTSADAITAVALHKLPRLPRDPRLPAHTATARAVTARLVRERLCPDGAFPGTHYRVSGPTGGPAPEPARVESVWALFFLLLALAIDVELITPDEF